MLLHTLSSFEIHKRRKTATNFRELKVKKKKIALLQIPVNNTVVIDFYLHARVYLSIL